MMKRLAILLALVAGLIALARAQTYPGQGPSVMAFGAHCDDTTDDTAAINAALAASSGIISIPPNVKCRTTGSLILSNPNQCLIGAGPSSQIDFKPANGTPAVPAVWIKNAATQACAKNFAINGNRALLIAPTGIQGTELGACVLVEADQSTVKGLWPSNCWDNGVTILFIDSGGVTHPGAPSRVVVDGIYSNSNGLGSGTGAAVDNASGSNSIVTNVTDNGSTTGFIADTGAGGTGTFSNITGKNNTLLCAYLANASSFYSNISCTTPTVASAQGAAIWADSGAANSTLINCYVEAPVGGNGVLIKGVNNFTMIGCVERDTPSGHDAVVLNTTGAAIAHLHIIDNRVTNTLGVNNRFGLNTTITSSLQGSIIGGQWAGASGAMNGVPTSLGTYFSDDGAHWGVNTGAVQPRDVFEVQGLGTFTASEFANHPMQIDTGITTADWAMPMGCDKTNSLCYIQSINVGVAKSLLALNQNGGNVNVGGTNSQLLLNSKLVASAAAPTVSSGFCTSPSIPNNNGTAAFTINVGTACAASTGTLSMPAAPNAWVCDFHDVTTPASNIVEQTGGATNTVTLTNYVRTTGVAGNFTSSDVIRAKCVAY